MGQALQMVAHITAAGGNIMQGRANQAALDYQAASIREAGKDVEAAALSRAQNEEHKAKILASRAIAVAAASGGSATDPTVLKIIGDIEGEGATRAANELYSGESQRNLMEAQANAKVMEGKNAKRSGVINAFGNLLQAGSDYSSLYDKYNKTPKVEQSTVQMRSPY